MGFSAGMHLMNAVMYAVTLAVSAAYCSLQLRVAGKTSLALLADIVSHLQPITFLLYTTLHCAIFFQLQTGQALHGLPQFQFVCCTIFLLQVLGSVLFIAAVLAWVGVQKCKTKGKTPVNGDREQENKADKAK